jgi:hypothetical protein
MSRASKGEELGSSEMSGPFLLAMRWGILQDDAELVDNSPWCWLRGYSRSHADFVPER